MSHYLNGRKPGGVSLEVVEEDIQKVDDWWRVPVRPSAWPEKRYEYYEALAEIESEIQEKEHLDLLIATGEPKEQQDVVDRIVPGPKRGRDEAELTKKTVAEKVREYLRACHPGGATLEVVEEEIQKVDDWWRVPIRPSAWPEKRYEYYEALAEIESEIQETEDLNILLATAEPREMQST